MADRFIVGAAPIDYGPVLLLMPFGFHLAMDTLPSGYCGAAAPGPPWSVSGFRHRARVGLSIPSSPPGQRGITPAFGYSAPHPSAGGTLTLLIHALPSAHYEPLRHPHAPSLSLTGVRLIIPDHALGLPVLRALSLCTCCRHYPGTATGRTLRSFTQPYQRSPIGLSGRPVHRPFRGLLGVHSRCGLHTRAVTNS